MSIFWEIILMIVILVIIYRVITFFEFKIYLKRATTGTSCYFYPNDFCGPVNGYIVSRNGDELKIHYNGKVYIRNIKDTYAV